MSTSAKAQFAIKSWDEKPYSEGADRPKLTRASVSDGSGTGELRGLRGDGTSALGHGSEYPFLLHYELD